MNWISVKDMLPPTDENILLFDGREVFCGDFNIFNRGDEICHSYGTQACDGTCYGWYEKQEITHWMPLPNAPEKKHEVD